MIKKVCWNCKKEFLTKPCYRNSAKFCSSKCYWESLKNSIPWNKGRKETRPEVLEKFRQSHIGQCAWNKGKKLHYPVWNKGKKGVQKVSEETCEKMKKNAKRGSKNHNWKGGKYFSIDGYIFVRSLKHPFVSKNGYVFEHRLIIEKHLGRFIDKNEVVHHINKITNDNRSENLMAFISNSAHKRFHKNPNNVKPFEIIFDGRKLK